MSYAAAAASAESPGSAWPVYERSDYMAVSDASPDYGAEGG